MPILFVAIRPPSDVAAALCLRQGGIRGARWEPEDKLHLTLRYVGDVDAGTMRRIAGSLRALQGSGEFPLTLAGVGTFPPRGAPRSLWVGVDDPRPVALLRDRIERILGTFPNLEPDPRKFAPHLTLARLKDAPPTKVAEFLTAHALLRFEPFVVQRVYLMSSIRTAAGSRYRIEAGVSLGP